MAATCWPAGKAGFADGSPYRCRPTTTCRRATRRLTFRNDAESVDLQFTHEPQLPEGQQLLWGAGYRSGKDSNDPSPSLVFIPPSAA
jgi:hypothetical protein